MVVKFDFLFDAIGEDAKGKSLSRRHGFFLAGTVGQNAGEIEDLSDPTAVGLDFSFDRHVEHIRTVTLGDECDCQIS